MTTRNEFQRRSRFPGPARAAAVTGLLVGVLALASAARPQPGQTLRGKDAFGDWSEDQPGVRRLIRPEDLPAKGPSVPNQVKVVARTPDAKPRVPAGFTVELVAEGLPGPRVIRRAPNGDLFVADSKSNTIRVYRVPPGSAKPAESSVYAKDLRQPYGIAFYPVGGDPQWVYVANSDGAVRFAYKSGDLQASGAPEKIVEHIPWQHHWTRDIAFSPDGRKLFFSVGSGSNVAQDMFPEPRVDGGLKAWAKSEPLGAAWDTEERRANVLTFDPDGMKSETYATGLRNCDGITFQPRTNQLWCVVQERDELGDDLPFEYATHVEKGAFYGWPWFYIGDHKDPRHPIGRPDLTGKVTVGDVMIQAHSSVMQIAFYDPPQGADDFPPDYRGSAFVTLHGSWNRLHRTGYKVIRLLFDGNGKATGEYEDFMTGFVVTEKTVWGRPVGVAVGQDGSLFVTEDGSGTIWRVTHSS
jgi:glucose/arabinose dehydrogenase